MVLIGITGPTGAGKTTLLREVEALGGAVIDCDAVYHELLEHDPFLQRELERRFGPLRGENGAIDRKRLGTIVFGDPEKLALLNDVVRTVIVDRTRALVEDYRRQDKYLGALVGRVANRIGGARFSLGGREYPLAANNGENHIHGGLAGFDRQVWQVEEAGADRLVLSLFSPDGQEGYPGDLSVRVTYTLSPEGLSIAYWARSSRDTLCNLTSHSYFNLNGHASGPVAGQYIQINAGRYTPADGGSIPTGELAPVEGTPMDLRAGVRIGARIDEDFPQLTMAGGYDHNWVVDGPAGTLRPAARAWSEETGIVLAVSTTMPGVQFYTGNYLDGCPAGKGNAPYGKRWGFCLETQFFPDAVHHPEFPSPVLRAGAEYRQETRFCFSVDK